MTTAAAAILASLAEVFAPMDAEVLEQSKVWAAGRVAAISEFKAAATAELRRNQWEYYRQLFAIAGGKTWYRVFQSPSTVDEFVTKNCAAIVAKRNATITRKLVAAGVTSVSETTYTRTRDGFDGVFVVETSAGRKTVTVNTIRAGGYNIQCLHLRVLVKVK